MNERRAWPDELLSYFKGSELQRLNQMYMLLFAPLCIPTHLFMVEGTRVNAYLTGEIREQQVYFLSSYSETIEEALEHEYAVRNGGVYDGSTMGIKRDASPTPETVVRFLIEQVNELYPGRLQNIGSDLIRRAGNRFLSGFALEKDLRNERIKNMTAYYKLCVRFAYPEDSDGIQIKQLCDRLTEDLLNSGAWKNPDDQLPEDPSEMAAQLLLAYLFLKYYMVQSFESLPEETKQQLRAASIALGFVDPSAQQLSRRYVEVDAEMLQEVLLLPLTRGYETFQDSAWVMYSVRQSLELLKDGDTILPGFSRWLDQAGAVLKKHYDCLDGAYEAAENEEHEEITKIQNEIWKLRMTIRNLQLNRNKAKYLDIYFDDQQR